MTSLKFMELVIGSFYYDIFISAVLYTHYILARLQRKNNYTVCSFSKHAAMYVRQLYRTMHSEMYFLRIERILKMYAR